MTTDKRSTVEFQGIIQIRMMASMLNINFKVELLPSPVVETYW